MNRFWAKLTRSVPRIIVYLVSGTYTFPMAKTKYNPSQLFALNNFHPNFGRAGGGGKLLSMNSKDKQTSKEIFRLNKERQFICRKNLSTFFSLKHYPGRSLLVIWIVWREGRVMQKLFSNCIGMCQASYIEVKVKHF